MADVEPSQFQSNGSVPNISIQDGERDQSRHESYQSDTLLAPPPPGSAPAQVPKEVDEVIFSDIGLTTLLDRLKQSIASARDFAAFLKKRSTIEEDHAKNLKRLARSNQESLHHAEARKFSFARQMEDAMRTHDKMADNGMQFALSLHQMHEDLTEMTRNLELGRKSWKHQGMDAEKRASDAEVQMTRAKNKYDGLAEDYDRAKTGDVKGSRKFIKGPKSAAQYEEDVLRKLQAADTDYQEKVNAARSQRQELLNQDRPRAAKALQDLIRECDSALTLQLQKFATFNEKLLLGNGILVTPLPSEGQSQRSLRDIMNDIDNDGDVHAYVAAQRSKVPARTTDIQYLKHPTLASKQQITAPLQQAAPVSPVGSRQPSAGYTALPPVVPAAEAFKVPLQDFPSPPTGLTSQPPSGPPSATYPPYPTLQQYPQQNQNPLPPHPHSLQSPGYPPQQSPGYLSQQQSGYPPQQSSGYPPQQSPGYAEPNHYNGSRPPTNSGPGSRPSTNSGLPSGPPYPQTSIPSAGSLPIHSGPPANGGLGSNPSQARSLPPHKPVFGVDLEELFQRDGSAVPMIIYQCMQAVDLFGLSMEGIYRQNGTAQHIQVLKSMFDNDASKVDFRNPATFHHDVNSVAGLLKLFFRDLPDPLLTNQRYGDFINAARIDDDTVRRDTLHAIINDLPDANYATLRALVLHLNRIHEHQGQNRMSSSNLAICFGPSLMGVNPAAQIQDSALQARVIDTILVNTYQIFDED